jgi:hypothetical protein
MDTMTVNSAMRPESASHAVLTPESNTSGVSWAAVFAGASVAAALALILLLLGVGLGLSSISPWSPLKTPSTTIGIVTIVWLILMQVIASGMGGYLAGRLRTKWVHTHGDEVFFRDTAHGLLAWAVALVITAGFLTSAATSIVGGGASLAGAMMTRASAIPAGVQAADAASPRSENPGRSDASGAMSASTAYYADALLRSDRPPTDGAGESRAQLGRILAQGIRNGDLSAQDRSYATQLVTTQTGLAQADADKRVSDVFAQAKAAAAAADSAAREAADASRRAAAQASLWLFVALLTGAFCASLAATIGGRQRDEVRVVADLPAPSYR